MICLRYLSKLTAIWLTLLYRMDPVFELLDPTVQKWVYKQGWGELREIQKEAVKPILSQNVDVVISASTAAGKTEAAFLPVCSTCVNNDDGFSILYISPLKALINDQYRRLESLFDMLGMRVTAWHGDSSWAEKTKAKRDPNGVVLITPESLESLLVREPGWVQTSFEFLKYIVIDEYHAFIGSERGHQLQSLMHRLEGLLERHNTPIPRIALSATLGDMDGVMCCLRPNKSIDCTLIQGKGTGSPLKFQLRGYVNRPPVKEPSENEYFNTELTADQQVALDLFETLRGDSHLVFANSRQRCEHFAVMLSDLCRKNHLPENEFFPHHGSLSKELRSDLESRLQKERLPTTAICTMTLELGIDIGKVKSVCQVTAPHSVSSLRQRLGRSGRRGDPAILRMYITENELSHDSNVIDMLRVELLQTVAMTHLLLGEKWFEPADRTLPHFSTLVHQILAVVAQWGGVRADQLWQLLCVSGPFDLVVIDHYKALLKHMGENHLISQLSSGEIVLGLEGEKLVSHYSFYAVFKTPEEYRVIVGSKTIGTLPVDSALLVGQSIVLGGRRWKVEEIDAEKKVIHVVPARGGRPPRFRGNGVGIHDRVRQEMFKIYVEGDHRIPCGDSRVEFMDSNARQLFLEGSSIFKDLDLKHTSIFKHSKYVYVIPWMGDKVVNTITVYLNRCGIKASSYAGSIEIEDADIIEVKNCLYGAVSSGIPSNTELATLMSDKNVDKYDYLLSEPFLNQSYGARFFDSIEALSWIKNATAQNKI